MNDNDWTVIRRTENKVMVCDNISYTDKKEVCDSLDQNKLLRLKFLEQYTDQQARTIMELEHQVFLLTEREGE
tara:strand:- start:757 stop:975 length:219 start_codon:yes stop_codon:yes gene_type:complete